jgi:hypothetical protein
MRQFFIAPAVVALLLAAAGPAFAQMQQPGASGMNSGAGAPQPRAPAPDIAPPALPGAGATPGLATAPVLQKPAIADPTTALFAAVNSGDYNAAQDAVSRGADPDAQNTLGETPLELSIALNRNSITFMLLSARNEGGGGSAAQPPPAMPATRAGAAHQIYQATPARMVSPPPLDAAPGNNPGVPDQQAGFLGFGKS